MISLRKYDERKWYSFKASELFKALLIAAVIYFIVYVIADLSWPRRYYVSDIQISKATVAESQQDEGKYYIRVDKLEANVPISSEKLWFEVKQDFFLKHNTSSTVGVSLKKSDSFKKNIIGGGRSFDATSWDVQEIYNSYEEAQQANQYKKYSAEAVLETKQQTENGQKSFVLKADEIGYNFSVDDTTFRKYSENQKVKCTFEAVGEFIKLISIEG